MESEAADPAAISQRRELAEAGAERVRHSEYLQLRAAYGKNLKETDPKLSSAAETGFVICAKHGVYCRSVNPKTGKHAKRGVCEFCYREDWSNNTLRAREQEVRDRIAHDEDELQRRVEEYEAVLRRAMDGDDEAQAYLESLDDAMGVGVAPLLPGGPDGDEAGDGLGAEGVDAAPSASEPARGPDVPGDDPFEAWLRRTGVEPSHA